MLNRWQIQLQVEGEMNASRGSIFHGWLMEQIPGDYAEYLHQSALKPFSQFLFFDRPQNAWFWQVSTLNREAGEIFRPVFEERRPMHLKHSQQTVEMLDIKHEETTYDKLVKKHYLEMEAQRRMLVRFLTIASFKVNQNYLIFPSVFHFYRSLMNRFQAFSENMKIEDEAVLIHLAEHTEIQDYRLATQRFSVGKGKIKGFGGSVTMTCSGPDTMVRLANLLFDYSNYSGIGIKTALGMGGSSYLKEAPKGDDNAK